MYSFLVDANVGNIKTSTSFHLGVFADHHFAFLQAFCCISFTLCSSILRFFPRINLNFDIITIFLQCAYSREMHKASGKGEKKTGKVLIHPTSLLMRKWAQIEQMSWYSFWICAHRLYRVRFIVQKCLQKVGWCCHILYNIIITAISIHFNHEKQQY